MDFGRIDCPACLPGTHKPERSFAFVACSRGADLPGKGLTGTIQPAMGGMASSDANDVWGSVPGGSVGAASDDDDVRGAVDRGVNDLPVNRAGGVINDRGVVHHRSVINYRRLVHDRLVVNDCRSRGAGTRRVMSGRSGMDSK